jgi:hypothetical protein
MEAPKQIKPKGPNDYLEVMTKAVFQSGISWRSSSRSGTGSGKPSSASTPRRSVTWTHRMSTV